jgi:serine/threonine-protein kinase RsbW
MKRTRSKLKLSGGPGEGDSSGVTVEFNSSLDRARQVEQEILDSCQLHRFAEADLFAIKLALEEALVNAVKHGNKLDPAKKVRVHYLISDQRADITIEDQGPGFNPAGLPDPTADENLECCSGRGILLMRAYMTSVVFNPQGNKVTLTKFNEGFVPPVRNAAMG